MRVLKYSEGTLGVGMLFKARESTYFWGYSDASHATCSGIGKGRICYMFMSAQVVVSWGSNRVGNASPSCCETEYMGLTMVAQEASYLS